MTAPIPPDDLPEEPPVEISPDEADRAADRWRRWLPARFRGLIDATDDSEPPAGTP